MSNLIRRAWCWTWGHRSRLSLDGRTVCTRCDAGYNYLESRWRRP